MTPHQHQLGGIFVRGLASGLIALMTVGYQALRVARTNPVDSLGIKGGIRL